MPLADLGDIALNYRLSGPETGPALVLSSPLGCDLTLWDALLPHLPAGLRVLRYDLRGQGQSQAPDGPYAMGALIRDSERLLEYLKIRDCVFVGLSIGGMVAQGLAVKRLDQVRALVLSSTAAKIATPHRWQAHMEEVRAKGLAHVAPERMARWFSPRALREGRHLPWQRRFIAQPVAGYLGGCAAMAGTDFYTPTSGLRLPLLGLAGSEDRETPPDLLRETTDLVPGATFQLLRGAGHLAPAETPEAFGAALNAYLGRIGHLPTDT